MTVRLRNFTPHIINVILTPGGEMLNLPSEGVARVAEQRTELGRLALEDGTVIPVTAVSYGEPVGLPAPEAGVILVVSQIVREACSARLDLASPGPLIRDAQGQPLGCQGLTMTPR